MTEHTPQELRFLQSLPMPDKVKMTRARIEEWLGEWEGQCYVSLSGGKDSAVLLHLVRQICPDVPAVFADTGLEHPEVRAFARAQRNVTVVRPRETFAETVKRYGYPLVSKHVAGEIARARRFDMTGKSRKSLHGMQFLKRNGETVPSRFDISRWRPLAEEAPFLISDACCDRIKKQPLREYEKETGRVPFIATLAEEGQMRRAAWLKNGCNAMGDHPRSTPMAFWTEQDVLAYILAMDLPIAKVYGRIEEGTDGLRLTGAQRTGCLFCGFGAHLEGRPGRFERMREELPGLYRYCMEGGEWTDNPLYDPDMPEFAQDGFRNFNPEKLWVPSKQGLGMGYVLQEFNRLSRRKIPCGPCSGDCHECK